jgi:hypothetical protein
MAQRLRETIDGIRAVSGYGNFLRPLSFSDVKGAADAPLVYLLATSAGGIALIVTQDGRLCSSSAFAPYRTALAGCHVMRRSWALFAISW